MGDFLVEGVGDEVVLFVLFLVLSSIFLVVAALWKRGPSTIPSSAPEEAAVPSSQALTGDSQAARTENISHAGNSTESEGLRHRVAPASREATNVDSRSPAREEQEHESLEARGLASGRRSEDAGMTIRLVRAGGQEHTLEVVVTPACTLEELRQ